MTRFLFDVAWRSAWNRRFTLVLTVCSIALSTFMLLGVERVRTDVRSSFTSAVSGTDLLVGARSSPVQLLLYAVFHIGAATGNVRWSSVEALRERPEVNWVLPLSLGDSHRGFPVLGTTREYFELFHYGEQQSLQMAQGRAFEGLLETVLGAEVAESLDYRLGQKIVLAHGTGELLTAEHADKPFIVVGILARTGTPVDRTVHISLQAMEAIHVDWIGGAPLPGMHVPTEALTERQLQPKAVTAALLGLHNRAAVFSMQRQVNEFRAEPLMAVLPGVALDELWTVIGTGERALLLMSALVAAVSLAGLVSVVLASLNERRRELAVLRATGAGPRHIVLLLALEGFGVTLAGMLLGIVALCVAVGASAPWLQSRYGLVLQLARPTDTQWLLLAALLAAGWLASLIPGWRAYRLSLGDGLSPRL